MNLMEEVSKLQQRLANAQREHTRAEGAYETAQAAADTAREQLKREFGVDTVQDGEKLLAELHTELAAMVAQLNAELDRIGVA